MRFVIAGFLSLLAPVIAFGQARGEVESIGFGGIVRPGCWTPMVVRLTPTTGNIFEGRLEVVQEDLDRDNVLFTRQIVLQGNAAGGGEKAQTFWMYFIPQPNRGERTQIDNRATRDELNKIIRVRLTTESGKELAKIPITQTITLSDDISKNAKRGQKVVLTVGKEHFARFDEYQGAVGITEDVTAVTVGDLAKGLPDDVIGYDGIDAIVWADANPEELNINPAQLTALQQYVRRGGRLVILQDTQANQLGRNNRVFADMMPVDVTGVVEEKERPAALRVLAKIDYEPLLKDGPTARDYWDAREKLTQYWKDRGLGPPPPTLATPAPELPPAGVSGRLYLPVVNRPWDLLEGPFKKATCTLHTGAMVAYADPYDGKPYIVRMPYGAGCVTWVAQDLADKQFYGGRNPTIGWIKVWDRVMDWPNEPAYQGQGLSNNIKDQFGGGITVETGKALLKYMDLPSTSAALIGIAVLFFIVYWVAAGPGSFLVLARKKKASLSWFAFAVLAIAGTAMTYLIVKLVLRGDAKVQHVTYVRAAGSEPAIANSDFGLYIPRDGAQKIELTGTAEGRASFVTAYNVHPAFVESDIDFPAKQDYYVPVKAVVEKGKDAMDPKVIRVPYRSTLKKLRAQWVGDLKTPGIVAGKAVTLNADPGRVAGALVNRTGRDLRNVFLCVNHPGFYEPPDPKALPGTQEANGRIEPAYDYVFYVASWKDGQTVTLDGPEFRGKFVSINSDPRQAGFARGQIQPDRGPDANTPEIGLNSWTEYWYRSQRSKNAYTDREILDDDPLSPRVLPILSFFDRLPPPKNYVPDRSAERDRDRFDFLRRGVRGVDMSAAVSAGGLAIVAVGDDKDAKLPFPMEVDGDKVSDQARGVVYYQFVLPVDRSKLVARPPAGAPPAPTSKPSTAPATASPPAPK